MNSFETSSIASRSCSTHVQCRPILLLYPSLGTRAKRRDRHAGNKGGAQPSATLDFALSEAVKGMKSRGTRLERQGLRRRSIEIGSLAQ